MIPIKSLALNKTLLKCTDSSTGQIFHELLGSGMKTLKRFCLYFWQMHMKVELRQSYFCHPVFGMEKEEHTITYKVCKSSHLSHSVKIVPRSVWGRGGLTYGSPIVDCFTQIKIQI